MAPQTGFALASSSFDRLNSKSASSDVYWWRHSFTGTPRKEEGRDGLL